MQSVRSRVSIHSEVKMKVFGAILLLVIVAMTHAEDEWQPISAEQMKLLRKECMDANPISDEQKKSLRNFVYPNELAVRKYLLCITERSGFFCPEMGFHVDRIVRQFRGSFSVEEATEIVSACTDSNTQGSPVDEWAYRIYTCFMSSKVGEQLKERIREEMAKSN